MKLLNRFLELNIWLKVIVFLCLLGAGVNTVLIVRDISFGGLLLRLHVGFWILYTSQIVFILLYERFVWVLAALQGVVALQTNLDFTFFPVVRALGRAVYLLLPEPNLEALTVYKYVLVSLSFTLQMLSAYAEFSLLPKAAKQPAVSVQLPK